MDDDSDQMDSEIGQSRIPGRAPGAAGDSVEMGRVGLEPTTNRLKAECSTN